MVDALERISIVCDQRYDALDAPSPVRAPAGERDGAIDASLPIADDRLCSLPAEGGDTLCTNPSKSPE